MNPDKFAALPAGSVVTHRNSEKNCAYRKHSDGGWQIAFLVTPHGPVRPDSTFRVDPGDGKDVTLVRFGLDGVKPAKGPSKKDLRIAELEADVAAIARQRDAAEAALARSQDEVARLRNVIRAARGTLGAN